MKRVVITGAGTINSIGQKKRKLKKNVLGSTRADSGAGPDTVTETAMVHVETARAGFGITSPPLPIHSVGFLAGFALRRGGENLEKGSVLPRSARAVPH